MYGYADVDQSAPSDEAAAAAAANQEAPPVFCLEVSVDAVTPPTGRGRLYTLITIFARLKRRLPEVNTCFLPVVNDETDRVKARKRGGGGVNRLWALCVFVYRYTMQTWWWWWCE